MNISNYYWYFKSALTPKFCDDVIAYANAQKESIARTGGYNKETWGNIYKPSETTIPLLNIDPVDLRNSPDYTLLYGVKVKDCMVRIHFEDNRRKGRSWDIPLTNNKFIMFPSTNMYYLTNNQKDSLNFVQTITYEYI